MSSSNSILSISFVGDISFSDSLFCQGFGVGSVVSKYGPYFLFTCVAPYLNNNDILFGNLETVLSRHGEDKNNLHSVDMRGAPECITALKKSGFTVLNVANNHAMQHGEVAFDQSKELLLSNNISPVGIVSQDKDWHCCPVIIQIKGRRVGFIGYSFEIDRYHPKPLYSFGDDKKIIADIMRLKDNVDFLVLSAHWGLENINRPSAITIRRAHSYIDAGADIIIGHHPHVLQGIENYKGKVIAYSLGNFIFDLNWCSAYRESLILKIDIKSRQDYSYTFTPVVNDKYFRPISVCDEKREEIQKKIFQLSEWIQREIKGDLEKNALTYYNEYKKITNRYRYLSYIYFLMNIHRYKMKYLPSQLKCTLRSRIEDFLANINYHC